MRSGLALILCVFSLLAGCGGGDGGTTPPPASNNPPPPPPPPPVVGAAGGTVTEVSGATIVVPAGAITTDTTIRIARDSTGAPPLPQGLSAVGNTYVITPHGGNFAKPVEVRIPAPTVTLLPTQELKLAKAQPGGEWFVLGDTKVAGGMLSAEVDSFSFFMTVIVTYQLPIAQFVPYQLTASLTCDGQPCESALGTVTATYTTIGNNGQVPANCPDMNLALFGGEGDSSMPGAPVPIPLTGGTLTRTAAPGPFYRYYFSAGYRCGSTGSYGNFGMGWIRSIQWAAGPAYPGLSVLRMPAQLDVVDGLPASLDVILGGGASKLTYSPVSLFFTAPSENDRATVDWQRSDDGGASWRIIARSFQNEANPLPFGTGIAWQQWSVRHGFVATVADQGALIRMHACYAPPIGAALPCITSAATHLNVLQQSGAPLIGTSPRSVLIRTGQTASFSASVSGLPAPSLQWQMRQANSNGAWTNVTTGTGATSTNYTTAATAVSDNGTQYRVLATNAVGSTASAAVTVSVSDLDIAPSIATQPASVSVASGSDAVFAVDARGTEAMSYQWYRNGAALAGANGPVLLIAGAIGANAGSYTVEVSNAAGAAISNAATLSVTAGPPSMTAPTIVTQPAAVTANAGSTATLAVGVNGTGPFTFQWRRDGANIAGATSAVLTFNSVALPNAGSYSVVVTNSAGSVTSSGAVLDVTAVSTPTAPTIASQPSTLIVPYRGSGVVAVGATGSGPLSYQWSKDGAELPGSTLPVLDFSIVAEQDVGTYTVTISNSVGSVVSRAVDIILLGAPVITQQPADVTALEGANATFFVAANSTGLRYQWSLNGNPIPGAIGNTLNIGPVVTANSGAVYSVLVYNGAGHVYSQGAVLTVQVIVAPTITIQPQDRTIQAGQTASICAAVGGTAPFAVLMQRWDGADWVFALDNIVFSDNTELCVASPALQIGDNGAVFRLRATNNAGAISTNGATITVQTPPSGPIVTSTTLVSRAWSGGPPNNMSNQPSISADGRYVAFTSVGTNVSEDSAIGGNAYVRDMLTGNTKLINYGYDGDASSFGVYNVKLSSNGRYAIFSSRAGDLVPGDTNDNMDIFRRDLLTGTNLRLSVKPNGDELENGVGGNGDYQLDISADGQSVIFLSAYDITDSSSNNGYYHLYHRYVQSGFTADVAGGSEYQVAYSALSEDGDHVAFAMGFTAGTQSIQVYDAEASAYSTVFSFNVSQSPAGLREGMSISNYGRYVAFSILAPDLLGSPYSQVIVADRNTQTYVVASMNLGVAGNGRSGYPEISADGRYVAFSTLAPSLTNNLATGSQPYLVVRDLVEQKTSIGSVRSNGTPVWTDTAINDQHALSEDGSTLAFVADYNVVSTGNFAYQVFAVARP